MVLNRPQDRPLSKFEQNKARPLAAALQPTQAPRPPQPPKPIREFPGLLIRTRASCITRTGKVSVCYVIASDSRAVIGFRVDFDGEGNVPQFYPTYDHLYHLLEIGDAKPYKGDCTMGILYQAWIDARENASINQDLPA